MKRYLGIFVIGIMILSTCFCAYAETEDLTKEQKAALSYAMDEKIIGGYTDGTVRPHGKVTRAEFVTMIVRYMGYETNGYSTFDDAGKDYWASKYIAAGVKEGLLNGVGNNKFEPAADVKVEHAAKILTTLKGMASEVDIDKSGGWPDAYMTLAEYAEIFNNTNHYTAGESLTRIDVAVLVYNISNIEKSWFDYDKNNKLCIYFTKTDGTNFGYYCGLTLKEKGQISDEPFIKEYNQETDKILEIVNAERAKKGYAALEIDEKLQKAAEKRAQEISKSFSHERPDGSMPDTVKDEFGIKCTMFGENIAMGQTSPEQVMEAWLDSPAHRENILTKNYEKIGIGIYKDTNGTYYWVQLFITE